MRTDLRVRRFPSFVAGGDTVRIDVTRPGENPRIKGVDLTGDGFEDDKILQSALGVLNASIARWPNEPVTTEQVRVPA